ncbi:MAG TPA: IS66 family transposase [Pseudolabrys sp.]|nr:IS66 family transposase [Pseudolabrys sp.]
MSTTDSLPHDVESLRALALKAIAERDVAIAERDAERIEKAKLVAERDRLQSLYEHVHHLLRKANDHRFGARNERLERLPADQLQLALEDIEASLAKTEAAEEKKEPRLPRTGTRKRGALPNHLPRIHQTVAPPRTNCPCCNAPMHMIGEETSERLDVLPAQYRVIVTHRPKFACRACEKVVQENAPDHLIKSGLPTEAMVASVIVAKYGWHLPLYRQAKMLAIQGIDIDRSTLAFWVGYAAAELVPLYERLKQHLLSSSRLAVDETPVPVLDPGRGRTKTGYFWSMARDDRPFGGKDPPAVAYTYAPGRGAVHLHMLLKNYRGIVQCDGYAPYKQLPDDAITLAFCWAHVRRGFFEIARKGNAPIATQALVRIAALYRIEENIRSKSAEERRAVRREKSAPYCEALKRFLEKQLGRVSAKAPIAQAIRYTLKHWQGLTRFLDDGRIDLDSNIVERSMRPQALTRKNALFAGHDDGAENWAIVASLIETCKLNGIDPYTYFADVLSRLVNLWPNARLDDLLPWNWTAVHDHLQRAA